MSKPVNEWVSQMEELTSERALFSRLIEYSGQGVAEKMQTLAKTGEVNTYSQPSRAPQQQQQEMGMERE